jgi:hypothetical protein
MFTSHDHHLVILTLRDLLAAFPPTTDPEAVSARQQARAILRKYQDFLNDSAHHIDT